MVAKIDHDKRLLPPWQSRGISLGGFTGNPAGCGPVAALGCDVVRPSADLRTRQSARSRQLAQPEGTPMRVDALGIHTQRFDYA